MLKNYFQTAWRNIIRSKGYSALNILGLAIGMAVTLLIGLWVYNEYSYDRFLPEYQQVYQVKSNYNMDGNPDTENSTPTKLAEVLRTEFPGIEYVSETDWFGDHGLKVADKKLFIDGGQVQSDFLKIFQFALLAGNANTVLKDPYSIVLTESTARALFGNEDPLSKTVRFDNKNDLKVTGILKDLPANSSFQVHYLVPFSYYEQITPWVKHMRSLPFGSGNAFQQFVKLKPGVSWAQIAPKIKDIEKRENDPNARTTEVILQPMKNWHLYTEYRSGREAGGFIEYVRLFGIIGLFVLAIACINFVNLTTARSEKRAREVGIRKAIGSERKDLVVQFLTESFVLVFLSFLLSIALVQLALPAFNILTKNQIHIPYSNGLFWLLMAGFLCVTALAAGSRPAFYLSSFQPVKVLKGALHVGKVATLPRKVLVVLQFSCSIALIISTMIVYQQIQHAKSRPTGYDLNRVMGTAMSEDLVHNFDALKNELIGKGIAQSVTMASAPATGINLHDDISNWPGKKAGQRMTLGVVWVRKDYFKTLGMQMAQGVDFDGIADKTTVILNEAAVKRLQLKQPLKQNLTYDTTRTIIGVVKDALMISPFEPADPTLFVYDYEPAPGVMMYRLSPQISTQEAIAKLGPIFNKYNPSVPFAYFFEDASYAAKFNMEMLVGNLSAVFAGLAILISCLGLFGLAAYMAEQRNKEIGIRKVLGASVSQIWLLLTRDFIFLVFISCLIASPIALYFLQGWLQKYDYRISIGPGVFVAAGTAAIVITLATISFQAIKAAIANPAETLKAE
ncbi:ABC transporter permease [Puia sp.]|jgi:ABC-type antimicrobial peptide transport system permease subunit|uniref:ABC transporter permease n=1 Tax=Puia sp. TaxID=2045100 RepID=UPI002F41ECAC